jgi:hypothetical protein
MRISFNNFVWLISFSIVYLLYNLHTIGTENILYLFYFVTFNSIYNKHIVTLLIKKIKLHDIMCTIKYKKKRKKKRKKEEEEVN